MLTCPQPESIEVLLSTVAGVSTIRPVVEACKEVVAKFKTVFTLFGKCHRVYNGRVIEDTKIDQLGR